MGLACQSRNRSPVSMFTPITYIDEWVIPMRSELTGESGAVKFVVAFTPKEANTSTELKQAF